METSEPGAAQPSTIDVFWKNVEIERLMSCTDVAIRQGTSSTDVVHARRYINEEFEAVQRYLSVIDNPSHSSARGIPMHPLPMQTMDLRSDEFWSNITKSRIHSLDPSIYPGHVGEDSRIVEAPSPDLNDEVEAVVHYACAALSHWNRLASVSRLPAEILTIVFRHLTPTIVWGPLHSSVNGRVDTARVRYWSELQCLIDVTHVCRIWRDIALNDTALWSNIWIEDAEWSTEMLRRTRDGPLAIVQTDSEYIDSLWPFLSLPNRIRRLCLHLVDSDDQDDLETILQEYLRQPAPLLEDLQIQLPYHSCRIPYDLFSQVAPRLKSLCIDGTPDCDAFFRSPIIRGLTTLELGRTWTKMEHAAILSDVVSVLRNNPDLETLILHGFFPATADPRLLRPITSEDAVHLPSLSFLDLDGDVVACTDLIRRLYVATVRMSVYRLSDHSGVERSTNWMSSTVIPLLHRPLQSALATPIQTVEVSYMLAQYWSVRLLDRHLHGLNEHPKKRDSDTILNLKIQSDLLRWSRHTAATVTSALTPWHLHDVRDLVINTTDVLISAWDLWANLFRRLGSLERLVIDCDVDDPTEVEMIVEPLLRLAGLLDHTTISSDGAAYTDVTESQCPRLHTICIRSCLFDGDIPSSLLSSLRSLCSQQDSGLRELHLIYSDINDSQKSALSEVVKVVVWERDADGTARAPSES